MTHCTSMTHCKVDCLWCTKADAREWVSIREAEAIVRNEKHVDASALAVRMVRTELENALSRSNRGSKAPSRAQLETTLATLALFAACKWYLP